jgi:hypothetical protein
MLVDEIVLAARPVWMPSWRREGSHVCRYRVGQRRVMALFQGEDMAQGAHRERGL